MNSPYKGIVQLLYSGKVTPQTQSTRFSIQRIIFSRIFNIQRIISGVCTSKVCILGACISGVCISGVCISKVCLSGVCLSGVCLSGVVFQEFVFQEFVFQEFVFQEFVTAPPPLYFKYNDKIIISLIHIVCTVKNRYIS